MTEVWSLQNHRPGEAQRIAHISEATPEEWRDLEGRYVTAITQQMSDLGADRLRVHLDRSQARDVSALQRWAPDIGVREALSYGDGESVAGARLEQFCRLCLRDLQGHGLSDAARGFFVFFGWDLHVLIGGPGNYNRATVDGLCLVPLGELDALADDRLVNMLAAPSRA